MGAGHAGRPAIADIFRLIRLPLVFTTTGDVLVGALGLSGTYLLHDSEIPRVLAVILSSACLYCFGMATNDIFDRRRDEKLHPSRPIPSGRLSLRSARTIAGGSLVLALGLAGGAGPMSAAWAGGMTLLILAYNLWVKRVDWLGPPGMGAIRGANVLFGWTALGAAAPVLNYDGCLPAVYVLVYITCTTVISTAEDLKPPEGGGPHARVVFAGLAVFALVALYIGPSLKGHSSDIWAADPFWVLGVITAILLNRMTNSSRAVTMATVRWLLFGLYFLDAHFIFNAGHPGVAWVVCAFVVPSLILSRLLRISS